MLNADAPDHTRLRALVNQAFTARIVDRLEGRITALAHDLLDRIRRRGHADLIAAFALPLPIRVIAELLGIPAQDWPRVRAWSNALVAPSADPARAAHKLAKSGPLMQDFSSYLRTLFAERRRRPKDDLITSLLAAGEAGDVLSEDELFSMILLLVVVGHETTVNLIGNGALALLTHPGELARLRADPSLLPGAVEELLRFDSPVERAPMRFAAEDIELHGVGIRQGDAVSVVLGSANCDPAVFAGPDTLDLGRTPNRHLSFGLGVHYCLGAALARLEGRIAFAALLERLPELALAVPVAGLRWRTQPIMRGLHRLPICWRP
jgi:cytochrome P450